MDNEDPFKSGFDGAAVLGAGNSSPGTSNVVRIADRFQKGYDPLCETELLDILRNILNLVLLLFMEQNLSVMQIIGKLFQD